MDSLEEKDLAYQKELDAERSKKQEVMKSVVTSHALLKETVSKFNHKIEKPINWVDLLAFPLNEWIELFPGIFARKYYEDSEIIMFDTKMASGTTFLWHEHVDCIEITEVLIGELYDAFTGTTFYKGESVCYPAGLRHTPNNTGDIENFLRVIFKKVEKQN